MCGPDTKWERKDRDTFPDEAKKGSDSAPVRVEVREAENDLSGTKDDEPNNAVFTG